MCKAIDQCLEGFLCGVARAGASAKRATLTVTCLTLVLDRSLVEQPTDRSCMQVDSAFVVVEGTGQEQ